MNSIFLKCYCITDWHLEGWVTQGHVSKCTCCILAPLLFIDIFKGPFVAYATLIMENKRFELKYLKCCISDEEKFK